VAAIVLFSYFFNSVPLPGDIGTQATVVYDAAGEELGTLEPQAGQREVDLTELPEHIPQAVLAAEDSEFYEHRGVSFGGLMRAAILIVLRREITQGGSTISQQYIKTVTGDDERTPLRKIREAALAVKLERQFSKDQILEFYLNTIYFGRGAYGIEAAAHAYFGKPATELTPADAALLAGIIPAPSALDPLDNPDGAARRYAYVVDRLLATARIDPTEAGVLSASQPDVTPPSRLASTIAPYFVDVVRRELGELLGEENIYRGYRVKTTLNAGVQAAARRAYQPFMGVEPTAALVAIDPGTGGIRALIGGKEATTDEFNAAVRAKRQPGSTFKTFALAAWVEAGRAPESFFSAPAEFTYEPCRDPSGDCTVSNYEGATYPNLSLREATWKSVNTVYAQVAQSVGNEHLIDIAEAAGIGEGQLSPDIDSLVLGSQGVTPVELAEAYNTFAAGGDQQG
jgi:penicillin-binding protein 1A